APLVDQLGFDAAIDYRNDDVAARLAELAPDGVDVFFDNVGGDILDTVLDNLAMRARVVICGAVSQYASMDAVQGPSNYLRLAERQSRMEGFAVYFFPDSHAPATAELTRWLADGSITMPEHVVSGIEAFGSAVEALYQGDNIGKTLVKIDR
ncbi:MAG: zinc-binding dehydrogenase, partial [Ilumatobacter sp.]